MGCGIKAAAEDAERLQHALSRIGTTEHALRAAAEFFDENVVLKAAKEQCDFTTTVCRLIDEKFRRDAFKAKEDFLDNYKRFKELARKYGG